MGGWRYDRRKPSTRLYEAVMGPLMVAIGVYLLVEWLIGLLR